MVETNEASEFISNRKRPSGKKSSVHYNDTTRLDIAAEQVGLNKVGVEDIINYTNEFLDMLEIVQVHDHKEVNLSLKNSIIDKSIYANIKSKYGLSCIKDIVWMKFTKDGYLGVVAVSNDINFTIPESEKQYNDTYGKSKWKYNTSGIIIHSLKKEWDESFVLVFPLHGIETKGLKRGNIECGIGNYLIDRGVPILDYYSHRY